MQIGLAVQTLEGPLLAYCVELGDNLISWSAKHQPTLSWSNAKAEYRGVANVVSEPCWIRNLLLELHCPITTLLWSIVIM